MIVKATIPVHDRILVERIDAEEISPGGIYIPDAARDKPQCGYVIAAGDGLRLDNGTIRPMSVKRGDMVLFGKYAGSEIEIKNKKVIIMREDDVLAVERSFDNEEEAEKSSGFYVAERESSEQKNRLSLVASEELNEQSSQP